MHPCGLSSSCSRDRATNAPALYGLNVTLRIKDLPSPDTKPEAEDSLYDRNSDVWSNHDYNLIQTSTEPGPLWLEFIASTYRTSPGYDQLRLSLCYRSEL